MTEKYDFYNITTDGVNMEMDVVVRLVNAETDTNMMFTTRTSFSSRELQYLKDSYEAICKLQLEGFGFSSRDKAFNLWVRNSGSIHEMELHDTRFESPYSSQGRFFFSSPHDIISSKYNDIKEVLNGETKERIFSPESSFSIVFPRIVEQIDNELSVCAISISSPFYHVTRKYDCNSHELEALKKSILEFENKKIEEFNILGDFMEISFYRNDDFVEVIGNITDFTWPEPNEITFHELIGMSFLKNMYTSLQNLSVDHGVGSDHL